MRSDTVGNTLSFFSLIGNNETGKHSSSLTPTATDASLYLFVHMSGRLVNITTKFLEVEVRYKSSLQFCNFCPGKVVKKTIDNDMAIKRLFL